MKHKIVLLNLLIVSTLCLNGCFDAESFFHESQTASPATSAAIVNKHEVMKQVSQKNETKAKIQSKKPQAPSASPDQTSSQTSIVAPQVAPVMPAPVVAD